MVEVRPARSTDVPALLVLHSSVAAEGRWIGAEKPVDAERIAQLFTQAIESERSHPLVATDSRVVVGYLLLRPTVSGVVGLGMAIDAAHRGRGIGTALLTAAVTWARRQEDVHKVELEVWPHNAAGLALYRKLGFAVEGRRRRQYRRRTGELWDSIVMGLVLDHTSPGSPHPGEGP